MHIVDHPSFLAGHGLPYAFTRYKAGQSSEMIEKPNGTVEFRNIGPPKVQTDEYPANAAPVEFP
jgi:hypothetical protein